MAGGGVTGDGEDGHLRCPRCGGPCSLASWEELGRVMFAGQCFRCGFLGKRVFVVEEWNVFVRGVFNAVPSQFTKREEGEIFRRLFPGV
jgi:Zn ribbon nucleic-acid-binding protein